MTDVKLSLLHLEQNKDSKTVIYSNQRTNIEDTIEKICLHLNKKQSTTTIDVVPITGSLTKEEKSYNMKIFVKETTDECQF